MQIDSSTRSLVKAISYRVWGTVATTLITYALTKNLELSVAAGVIDTVIKIGLYFVHERLWQKISFGKKIKTGSVLWLTGLPSSGKSTLGLALHNFLIKKNKMSVFLDGDDIRKYFPRLGFSKDDRNEHVKRVALMAHYLEQQGNTVIVSLVSPYVESRLFAKAVCKNFSEIYLNASVDVCKNRDVKGLYKKAFAGEIQNMTGVQDVYEIPINPDLILETGNESFEDTFKKLKKYLKSKKYSGS